MKVNDIAYKFNLKKHHNGKKDITSNLFETLPIEKFWDENKIIHVYIEML